MTRRISMAVALLLTTIAGFIIVSYGAREGIVGDEKKDSTSVQAPAPPAEIVQPTAPPPQVIERTVYRDEYVQAPGSSGGNAPGGETNIAPNQPAAPASNPQPQGPPPQNGNPTAPPTQPPAPAPVAQPASSREVTGIVTEKDADSFTLSSATAGTMILTVTPGTQYESDAHSSLDYSGIEPGMKIKAKIQVGTGGTSTGPGGSWVATLVKELAPDEDV